MKALGLLLAVVALAGTGAAETRTVYHIGNSVTDTIRYDGLKALAESRGHTHTYGRTMIPGSPLAWLWTHPADGFEQPPFGKWREALPNHKWDVVTLQPFDRHLGKTEDPVPTEPGKTESDNDLPVIRGFVALALKNPANADTQFYIYSRWPRRDGKDGEHQPLDYQAKWDRTYTGGWDGTNETRDYFQKLTESLNSLDLGLKKKVLIVPVGDVLYELDKRMEAGQVPGFKDVVELYSDGIHFNNAGSYIVALTFYATIYRDHPQGMGVPANWAAKAKADREITPEQAAAFQRAVWHVVAGHPYSGVPAAK